MSKTLKVISGSANYAFLSRLRPGRYTSPNGVKSSFLFDDLSRTRAKKTSAHEITDADTSIIQDLGSALQVFSMAVYFVGDDCDIQGDAFFNSLYERYAPDAPGILNHPRWGNVPVIPFGAPEQTESYAEMSGISRVTVEFRETASLSFASTSGLSAAAIANGADKANTSALSRAKRIATSGAKAYSKFRGIVKDKVNKITTMVTNVTDQISSVKDEVDATMQDLNETRDKIDAIKQSINDALEIAAAPAQVLAQVSAMIETIASIPQNTADLFHSILGMTDDVIDSFGDDVSSANTSEDVINTGLTLQCITTACITGSAIAATNIDYKTRDQVGGAIDALVASADSYNALMSQASSKIEGNILKSFDSDTDVAVLTHGVIRDTQALLLDRSFALRSRKPYRLQHPSDPLTETWTRYGDLAELAFFCQTNKIVMNEFIELPAGRELVFYE